jgi:hypothetical protein
LNDPRPFLFLGLLFLLFIVIVSVCLNYAHVVRGGYQGLGIILVFFGDDRLLLLFVVSQC